MAQDDKDEATALDACKNALSIMLLACGLAIVAMLLWALTHSLYLIPKGEQTSASFWRMWRRIFLPLLGGTTFCSIGVIVIGAHQKDERNADAAQAQARLRAQAV